MRPRQTKIIVIGTSAGAIQALNEILPRLPGTFKIPIVIVVHIPADRDSKIVEIFQERCSMRVKEAEDKEKIENGVIYFAPRDYHLLIERDAVFSLSSDEIVNFSRPSIDVLFESTADAFKSEVVGVVLTGASSDGANGLKKIFERGGQAIIQQFEHAYASAMPYSALRACPQATVLELNQIADVLVECMVSDP